MVLFALMAAFLLGILALAMDAGNLYLHRRQMQAAADLAALSGAQRVYDGTQTDVRTTAAGNASRNGYADATVHAPPATGPHTGDDEYVEVTIERDQPTFFAGILGISHVKVAARAVARGGRDTSPYAILSLSETASPGIDFGGSSAMFVQGAGVMSNSNASPSVKQHGSSTIHADGPINAVGAIEGDYFAPAVKGGRQPQPDPLAGMPPPTFLPPNGLNDCPLCDVTVARNGTPNHPDTLTITGSGPALPPRVTDCQSDDHTFCPGVYYGGIQMNGGTYSMMPGIYVIAGGGFKVTGGELSGSGIMIYNTNDPAKPNGKGDYGPINFNTNQGVALQASHDPQYHDGAGRGWGGNILIFQDRDAQHSSEAMGIQANGTTDLYGTVYVPGNEIKITGGGATDVVHGQVIADTFAFEGSGDAGVAYDADWTTRTPGGTLVE